MNTLHNPFEPSSRYGIVSFLALGGNILRLLQTEFFVHLPNCPLPLVSTFQSRDRAVIGREKVGMGRIPSGLGGDDGNGSGSGSGSESSLPGHAMDVESVDPWYAVPSCPLFVTTRLRPAVRGAEILFLSARISVVYLVSGGRGASRQTLQPSLIK